MVKICWWSYEEMYLNALKAIENRPMIRYRDLYGPTRWSGRNLDKLRLLYPATLKDNAFEKNLESLRSYLCRVGISENGYLMDWEGVRLVDLMVPVLTIYYDFWNWSIDRQREAAKKLAICTVNQIVSKVPYIPKVARNKCLDARTEEESISAAKYIMDSAREEGFIVEAARFTVKMVEVAFSSTATPDRILRCAAIVAEEVCDTVPQEDVQYIFALICWTWMSVLSQFSSEKP